MLGSQFFTSQIDWITSFCRFVFIQFMNSFCPIRNSPHPLHHPFCKPFLRSPTNWILLLPFSLRMFLRSWNSSNISLWILIFHAIFCNLEPDQCLKSSLEIFSWKVGKLDDSPSIPFQNRRFKNYREKINHDRSVLVSKLFSVFTSQPYTFWPKCLPHFGRNSKFWDLRSRSCELLPHRTDLIPYSQQCHGSKRKFGEIHALFSVGSLYWAFLRSRCWWDFLLIPF